MIKVKPNGEAQVCVFALDFLGTTVLCGRVNQLLLPSGVGFMPGANWKQTSLFPVPITPAFLERGGFCVLAGGSKQQDRTSVFLAFNCKEIVAQWAPLFSGDWEVATP